MYELGSSCRFSEFDYSSSFACIMLASNSFVHSFIQTFEILSSPYMEYEIEWKSRIIVETNAIDKIVGVFVCCTTCMHIAVIATTQFVKWNKGVG